MDQLKPEKEKKINRNFYSGWWTLDSYCLFVRSIFLCHRQFRTKRNKWFKFILKKTGREFTFLRNRSVFRFGIEICSVNSRCLFRVLRYSAFECRTVMTRSACDKWFIRLISKVWKKGRLLGFRHGFIVVIRFTFFSYCFFLFIDQLRRKSTLMNIQMLFWQVNNRQSIM